MADDDDSERIGVPRDRIAAIGSERLALALANGDLLGIGQALRHDYVVVPLTRSGEGDSKLLVTAFTDDEGRQRFELPLFSSAQTLSLYAGQEQNTEFAVRLGATLVAVLEQNSTVLDRVLFDPAGPHPMTASATDVLASLQPRVGDDEVAWAASAGSAVELDQILAESGQQHPLALDIRLADSWTPIDLDRPAVEAAARKHYPGFFAKSNRLGLQRFIDGVVDAAKVAGARFLAVTVVPVDGEPLGVAITTNWHEIGPAIGDVSHLDRMTDRLGGEPGSSAAGRYTRVSGDAPLVEYWLEFADQRGLATIAFTLSNGSPSAAVLELTDRVVQSATWVS